MRRGEFPLRGRRPAMVRHLEDNNIAVGFVKTAPLHSVGKKGKPGTSRRHQGKERKALDFLYIRLFNTEHNTHATLTHTCGRSQSQYITRILGPTGMKFRRVWRNKNSAKWIQYKSHTMKSKQTPL